MSSTRDEDPDDQKSAIRGSKPRGPSPFGALRRGGTGLDGARRAREGWVVGVVTHAGHPPTRRWGAQVASREAACRMTSRMGELEEGVKVSSEHVAAVKDGFGPGVFNERHLTTQLVWSANMAQDVEKARSWQHTSVQARRREGEGRWQVRDVTCDGCTVSAQ